MRCCYSRFLDSHSRMRDAQLVEHASHSSRSCFVLSLALRRTKMNSYRSFLKRAVLDSFTNVVIESQMRHRLISSLETRCYD